MHDMAENAPQLSYGRQWIDEDDILAVAGSLRDPWLTQGPKVDAFEKGLCDVTGARHAVVVSSGTAALHLAALAMGVGPGRTAVVPAITFVASANAIAYAGGRVRFADVDEDTALINLESLEQRCEELRTAGAAPSVLVAVDMCGQPAALPAIRRIAERFGARVIEDAAHALGATYTDGGRVHRAASCAHSDAAILSFHPVKHITTGEGGAVLTNDDLVARQVRELRSHGIHRETSRFERAGDGPWYYEQSALGFNYRLTDLQCALGLSQLSKLNRFVARRRELAGIYDRALSDDRLASHLRPLTTNPGNFHAYHLYVVRVLSPSGASLEQIADRRKNLYAFLREQGIQTQVHYIPVNWHPYYRRVHGSSAGDCPGANAYYAGCLSLPMYPSMSDSDVSRVARCLRDWVAKNS